MRQQLLRGASVFTVGVVSLALSATSVSAGGADYEPPKGGAKHGEDVTAIVKQIADNTNSTRQSSSATVDNQQKNWNSPFSLFTVGSGSGGGGVYSACGCDEHPSGGGVTQSNDADNDARSATINWTDQSVDQSGTADAASVVQGGGWHGPKPSGGYGSPHPKPDDCGCYPGHKPDPKPHPKPYPKPDDCGCGDTEATVDQEASNRNSTDQSSNATVDNHQKNWNSPVSIGTIGSGGGYGDGCGCDEHSSGGVDQSNSADNTAKSGTVNGTEQSIVQDGEATASSESEGGYESKPSEGHKPGCGCDGGGQPTGGGDTVATVGQHGSNDNSTAQDSSATVDNRQTNINLPITLFSVGSGNGDVNQGNEADNTAKSVTVNGTDQSVDQNGDAEATSESDCNCGGGGGGDTEAAVEQDGSNDNSTDQHSQAAVENNQTNVNVPITLFSVGSGNGDVSQGNQADNTATSGTVNTTDQSVDQSGDAEATSESDCGCGGGGDTDASVAQQAGNSNETVQDSSADVTNDQLNVNAPITLFSVGSGNGDVDQSNSASNTATSGTANGTSQGITQAGSAVGSLLGG